MSHIFISYSHKDSDYAHTLADNLQSMGFKVWIDARLDYGSQWPLEIQKQLDSCDAFIVIMSPRSYESEWVQSELQRAKRKLKPIFPLLLEGNEPWLSVESTQYYDVRGGTLPDAKFYSALKQGLSIDPGSQTLKGPKSPLTSQQDATSKKPKTGIFLAYLGAAFILFVIVMAVIRFNNNTSPTPSGTGTATSRADVTSTSNPIPTTTIPTTLPTDTLSENEIKDEKGVIMVLVPEGKFTMGNDSGLDDEKPAHPVYLDAFYIDKYEVTNALYKACVDAGACQSPKNMSSTTRSSYYGNPEFDNYPVIYLEWDTARNYCEWRDAHLPTEAQWEKAARGTKGYAYPWGEGIDETYANYNQYIGDTTAVGSYEKGKSPYGVYDMAGNVWEWVADWYSDTYYQDLVGSNPVGPDTGEYHVLRGGSWLNDENTVRTFSRGWNELVYFDHFDFGFRCSKEANP